MTALVSLAVFMVFFGLSFFAWRRYLWAARKAPPEQSDTCKFSLTDEFGDRHLVNAPHQEGIQWLTDVFSRSARKFPDFTALQIPHTGESLTYAELNARAETVAEALSHFLTGPDQVVAVAMSQDNWQIVASHLGILKAGGTLMFLDTSLPESLITHMLHDAQPVAILTRGQDKFRDLPTLDVLTLPESAPPRKQPHWMDDPAQRLATIFYTSGTTGMPKGVECAHAGYVNLALTYADYFDLTAGMDASSLTSSLGYDGSISEMYSAWVSGCAVVMLTKEQVRSGPDLVPILRDSEVTVLFCPPILLTTLTPSPELDLPYPLCRYVVPAGEAFPAALVEPWTRGRRQIINTYGPTEASTDTSRQSLRPDESITIGSPFPNVTYVILEEGELSPLHHGEVGELCIGGVHVARGYRNLPEQTAQKFIEHPQFGRLYRTGDRCRIDASTHCVEFLGRTDAQLKVRGHRVEIQGVEDILQTQFPEIEAAVLDYQNEELVAFIAAPSLRKGDVARTTPAPKEWAAEATTILTRQLPEPSVPSRIFLVEDFILKPTSGKIDREQLPKLSDLLKDTQPVLHDNHNDSSTSVQDAESLDSRRHDKGPSDELGSEEILEICSSVFGTSLEWDDVFSDNGGHSIAIARLAQRLHASGWTIPVRALLTDCDTARKVASRPRNVHCAYEPDPAAAKFGQRIANCDEAAAKVFSVAHFTTLQALFLLLLYSPPLIFFLVGAVHWEIGEFFITSSLLEFIAVGLLGYLLALIFPFSSLLWVMAIKLLMNGDIYKNNAKPGVYPKWSRMHLRTWCIWRMERSVLVPMNTIYRSAPLMAFGLRQLGAKVGDNLQCAQDAEFSGPLDLLTIDDDVAIQTGAYLHLSRWIGQELHIGPIYLESRCKIGMRSAIANDVRIGHGSWIGSFTPILGDVGPQGIWEGAPARFSGRCTQLKRTASRCQYAHPIWSMEVLNILMQCVLDFFLMVVPLAGVAWFAESVIPIANNGLDSSYFNASPLYEIALHISLFAMITSWVTIVLTSLLTCLFLRCTPIPPGLYPSRGFTAALLMYRLKKMNQIQKWWTWTITGQYLRALAGVHFTRVGASECDVMFNLVPELATADAKVFWSNGCFTNMLDYGAEHLRLCQLDMPSNFFSGNNSVAESGHFPSNFLLGVSTLASDIQFRRQMRSRPSEPLTVVGNPPMKIPGKNTEAELETDKLPTFSLFLARVFLNDIFSISFLPIASGMIFAISYIIFLRQDWPPIVSALISLVLSGFILVASCAAIKKLVVGSNWGSDHSTPFWSLRHFAYFFAQDCFFAWCRIPLEISAGTVLSNTILRWMGCKIGKRTIIPTPMQASDWNAVSFGDDCIVAGFLQFHTFEDMVLKTKLTDIQNGSTVNFGATVMGGAVFEPETTVLPLGMVLKEMYLPTGVYEGSPTELASAEKINEAEFLSKETLASHE
ncbi:MAG: AMP-binding protein [Anderseniella sp.]